MSVTIGVDIGQKRDPTAICVAETERRQNGQRKDTHFLIRHLGRLPLGTPYPDVAREVARISRGASERSEWTPSIYIDATGVGAPVVELIEAEDSSAYIYAVHFNHGDRRRLEHRRISLGKAYLVSRLQTLLQSGRIHLPRTAEAEVLAKELQDYEIRVDDNANDKYGAFNVGTHDDLVTALGLATQVDGGPTGGVVNLYED